ncbi:MAG: CCA tRNA nucleotidyltransferase, partial [Roseibium sp.]
MTGCRITAEWLQNNAIQAVFDAIERDGDVARVVGGAVRNCLLDKPVADIDIATTAAPPIVAERAELAGLKVIPTGVDHGTVTVISNSVAYEITTLREDVETFGRQAKVRFGRDWSEDARRRDFTMNALYCDRSGSIHDP